MSRWRNLIWHEGVITIMQLISYIFMIFFKEMFKQSVDCIIYLISYLTALINAPIFILLQDRTYLSSYP